MVRAKPKPPKTFTLKKLFYDLLFLTRIEAAKTDYRDNNRHRFSAF
jgi:hypothetical protein